MKFKIAKTSALSMAYEEGGPSRGEPVILLHGWPDDVRTWDGVVPGLAAAGYRTIAPYIRGYGPSCFRKRLFGGSPKRTGQPVAFAQDVLELADRLRLKQFHFVGHDWGAATGYALAALAPQRLKSLVTISVPFQPGKPKLPAFPQARAYWYQWLLCTHSGEQLFRADPVAYGKAQWDAWSPAGWYTQQQLAATSPSWHGQDFQDVVLHSYRSRWGHAPLDPAYAKQQSRYESTRQLHIPTLLLHGAEDHCTLRESTDGAERYFFGGYRRIILDGVGHFPQRENPEAVTAHILSQLRSLSQGPRI